MTHLPSFDLVNIKHSQVERNSLSYVNNELQVIINSSIFIKTMSFINRLEINACYIGQTNRELKTRITKTP